MRETKQSQINWLIFKDSFYIDCSFFSHEFFTMLSLCYAESPLKQLYVKLVYRKLTQIISFKKKNTHICNSDLVLILSNSASLKYNRGKGVFHR